LTIFSSIFQRFTFKGSPVSPVSRFRRALLFFNVLALKID